MFPNRILILLIGVLGGAIATWAQAGSAPNAVGGKVEQPAVTGQIVSDGTPVAGAMVTAINEATGLRTTVFSDAAGGFRLPVSPGDYDLLVRGAGRLAEVDNLSVGTDPLALGVLSIEPDPEFLARVPSARWLDLLPDGDMKREFILNCTSCHEIDAARILVDGKPRTVAQWQEAFQMMRAIDEYNILPPDFDDNTYAAWLAQYLSAERIDTITPVSPANPEALAHIVITEYPLPMEGSLPHDLVVGPDGRIWITAFFYDLIWALDPESGAIETFKIRDDGAEGWGQTRALVFDRQGYLWIILGGTHELVRLDPRSGEFKTYDVGMYAHSLALDSRGRVWINDYFARQERIGVFDPANETVRHINVPSANLSDAEGLPLPYGLQIDSQDRLYSTQLAANTLVLYDIPSGAAKLYQMPASNSGPRRPAIGTDDRLWVPEWNTGHLTSFDPRTETFTRYAIGSSALGAYDAEVDRRTGEVWVTGALAASMLLFDPDRETTLEIPLPTNPAYTRHLAVDPRTGDLWSAYSSLPPAEPLVVRIQRLQ